MFEPDWDTTLVSDPGLYEQLRKAEKESGYFSLGKISPIPRFTV